MTSLMQFDAFWHMFIKNNTMWDNLGLYLGHVNNGKKVSLHIQIALI